MLAECRVLARLWGKNTMVGMCGGVTRDHPMRAFSCLSILKKAAREGLEGLVGLFCRSISWGDVRGWGGEQKGNGVAQPG